MATDTKPRNEQPLHAAQIADALLELRTVQALTGLGRTSVYARIKTGEFKPIHLGKRAVRFNVEERPPQTRLSLASGGPVPRVWRRGG